MVNRNVIAELVFKSVMSQLILHMGGPASVRFAENLNLHMK